MPCALPRHRGGAACRERHGALRALWQRVQRADVAHGRRPPPAGGDEAAPVAAVEVIAADAPAPTELRYPNDDIDQAFLESRDWSASDVSDVALTGEPDGAPAESADSPFVVVSEATPVEDITLEGEKISIESPADLPVDFDLGDLDLDSTDEFEVITDVPDSAYPPDDDDLPLPLEYLPDEPPAAAPLAAVAVEPAAAPADAAPVDALPVPAVVVPSGPSGVDEDTPAATHAAPPVIRPIDAEILLGLAPEPRTPVEDVLLSGAPTAAARPPEAVVVPLRPPAPAPETPPRRTEPSFEALLEPPSTRAPASRRATPGIASSETLSDLRWRGRVATPEATPEPRAGGGRTVAWAVGCTALAIALAAQAVHQYRQDLARDTRFGPLVGAMYERLGLPLSPGWDVAAYELRQWGAGGLPDAGGQVTVHANLTNKAAYAQPHPVLRLEFDDRYGGAVASRDFQPAEYLKNGDEASRMLAPGASAEIELQVVEPDRDSVGYQLDVCLPESKTILRCARGPG